MYAQYKIASAHAIFVAIPAIPARRYLVELIIDVHAINTMYSVIL
jgi:hypothetical protein